MEQLSRKRLNETDEEDSSITAIKRRKGEVKNEVDENLSIANCVTTDKCIPNDEKHEEKSSKSHSTITDNSHEKDEADNEKSSNSNFTSDKCNIKTEVDQKKSTETDQKESTDGDVNSSSTTENSSNFKGEDDEKSTEFASLVAAHYNSLENCKYEARSISRIYYLRNFNNWVKSMLIKECLLKINDKDISKGLTVLDMCCGKGGDLQKWRRTNIKYLICADIAETSLEQCQTRYKEIVSKCRRNDVFQCEFIPADCTRVRLRSKFKDPTIKVDIVSCQFSFHYCFESLPQAECMLKNASECLKPGGVFIGTIPNANEIVKRIRKSEKNGFGNEVFSIEMCCDEPYPLFGAKYNFYLEGVVNCPEFLVHFPTFERLGKKFGLKLVHRERFTEFFNKRKRSREGEMLLKRMIALETYPPTRGMKLVGPENEYKHSVFFYENNNRRPVGTLSQSEWDVISLYQTFIFVKGKTTWDSEGKPQFEF